MSDWYFSRGDAELYDRCGRARAHRTILHTGRGIVRIGNSFEQSYGRIIHTALENILLKRSDVSQACAYAKSSIYKVIQGGEYPRKVHVEFYEQFLNEAQALAGGMVWAWAIAVLPEINASYNIIQVEGMTQYRKDGMVLPTVADVVLESKDDETLVYPDWKTTAWVNPQWMDQWNRSAQLFMTARAVEQVLGREIEYCYVQALVKGKWQKGYQQSPLCWAYHNEKFNPAKAEEDPEWSFKYKAGKKWRKTSPWVEQIPTERWVRMMPRDVLSMLVPRTPPIPVNVPLADTWWRQRVIKERAIQKAKEDLQIQALVDYNEQDVQKIMDTVFPQDFTQCNPVIGFGCDFQDICHDPHGIGADPIGSGNFRKRPTYQERLKEENAAALSKSGEGGTGGADVVAPTDGNP